MTPGAGLPSRPRPGPALVGFKQEESGLIFHWGERDTEECPTQTHPGLDLSSSSPWLKALRPFPL